MDVKMKKKKVAVLLSIYNGRKFLDELLLSLEAQQMVDVYLLGMIIILILALIL